MTPSMPAPPTLILPPAADCIHLLRSSQATCWSRYTSTLTTDACTGATQQHPHACFNLLPDALHLAHQQLCCTCSHDQYEDALFFLQVHLQHTNMQGGGPHPVPQPFTVPPPALTHHQSPTGCVTTSTCRLAHRCTRCCLLLLRHPLAVQCRHRPAPLGLGPWMCRQYATPPASHPPASPPSSHRTPGARGCAAGSGSAQSC